jgi:hypothetical protein
MGDIRMKMNTQDIHEIKMKVFGDLPCVKRETVMLI